MNQQVAAAAAAAAQRTELMRKIVEGRMQGAMGTVSPGTPSRCVCLKVKGWEAVVLLVSICAVLLF